MFLYAEYEAILPLIILYFIKFGVSIPDFYKV